MLNDIHTKALQKDFLSTNFDNYTTKNFLSGIVFHKHISCSQYNTHATIKQSNVKELHKHANKIDVQ